MNQPGYWVYVLINHEKRFYVGWTEKVETRLAQHNSGISNWTRHRGPWQLVWNRGPMSLTEARKLEGLLKRQKGGQGFFALTGLSRSSGS
jgi:putative endonuclease